MILLAVCTSFPLWTVAQKYSKLQSPPPGKLLLRNPLSVYFLLLRSSPTGFVPPGGFDFGATDQFYIQGPRCLSNSNALHCAGEEVIVCTGGAGNMLNKQQQQHQSVKETKAKETCSFIRKSATRLEHAGIKKRGKNRFSYKSMITNQMILPPQPSGVFLAKFTTDGPSRRGRRRDLVVGVQFLSFLFCLPAFLRILPNPSSIQNEKKFSEI